MTRLILETQYGKTVIETVDNDLNIDEMLTQFEQLLRGAGYLCKGEFVFTEKK